VEAAERDRAAAAGKPHPVGHLGDGADARIIVFVAGDEQHSLLRPDVHGQGHVHVGEDDDVFQGDEQHPHAIAPSLGWCHTPINYKKDTGIPAPRQSLSD
jgi:hypothetical protein